MKIIVCVKQVPGTSQVEVDPVTGVLRRDKVAGKLNPYDLFALETAFSLVEQYGGTVETVSMGPPQARDTLLETLWMGADGALLLSDRKFGGADVAATSYALSLGIRSLGDYDLVLCGKQTTDGDTAQVGPELAERLGIEHAANVVGVKPDGAHTLLVKLDLDDCFQTQRMDMPCLLTVDKEVNTPRLPSYRRKMTLDAEAKLRVLSAADCPEADEEKLGLKGSPTQVERIFPPEKKAERQVLKGTTDGLTDRFLDLLKERKFI